jgi:hypothetical protein
MELATIAAEIFDEVRPYTMTPPANLAATIGLVIDAIEARREGDLAEFGTWMGGASFAMLLVQRRLYGQIVKPVWLFDSFAGLPPADERDGPLAFDYQRNTAAPDYHDNCTAPLAAVQEAIAKFGFSPEQARVVPGWFNDTVPVHRSELARRGIAVLRVDCDFYAPVRYVLEQITPLVPEEGAVILDDYFAWDGCARATHDFLSHNNLSWRIRSMQNSAGAWMIKRAHRSAAL